MSKTKRTLIIIFSVVITLGLFGFMTIYFLFLHHYKGSVVDNPWTNADEFNIETIAVVEKDPDKDFVILNFADIQMADLEDIFHMKTVKAELTYLIEQTKPDIITLTGDQTWSNENLISLKTLVGWLDGFKIPYAPIFGNHDYGNSKNSSVFDQNKCCDIYERGKYSLFSRGPSNLGTLGNYVVNIIEDGKVYRTLYMLDSGYEDKITDKQIEWFKWNCEGIKNCNGGEYSEGMCFLHKPLPQYSKAYNLLSYEERAEIDDYYNYSLHGSTENGFFDAAKERGVKNIVCGHQHGNNFTLSYQGVSLTFALKTDELGGYIKTDDVYLNGATYFILNSSGTQIKNIYVDENQFHMTDPINK